MLRKSLAIAVSSFVLIAAPVGAQNPPGLEELPSEAVPAPLPPPDYVEHDEELEPEITIVQRKDATVEEYRLNGLLYMVKITPIVGKAYYFVDRDGDGIMESKMSDAYNNLRVPQWVILSW
ncbi:MAG: DUF2782 domain-containing protein [Proteobacteria bacterium]|nr:DUF2782 domain-containing protein [Pseudomonadota bacterium]